MSFSPLPDAFLTDLRDLSTGPTVELGCGDGRFTRILAEAGACVVASDRSPGEAIVPGMGVLSDATEPPFRHVGLLIAANLLRHLRDAHGRRDPIDAWIDCLAPGGRLYVFEDEPAGEPGPAGNYRDLQSLLARIVPWRKPLLPRCDFERGEARRKRPGHWQFGLMKNQFPPNNTHDVVSLLTDDRGVIASSAKVLARRVAVEGLDYGHYWWARFERENY